MSFTRRDLLRSGVAVSASTLAAGSFVEQARALLGGASGIRRVGSSFCARTARALSHGLWMEVSIWAWQ
jgi:hypothetical protein